MVDSRHQSHFHKSPDQVICLDPHTFGQFADRDRLAYLDNTLDCLRGGNLGLLAV